MLILIGIALALVALAVAGLLVIRTRGSRKFALDDTDPELRELPPLLFSPKGQGSQMRQPPSYGTRRQAAPKVVESASTNGVDGIMQLLPGRLEPVSGSLDQEIRFVKMPGINRFTLGRSAGPAYAHVQLHAPTASRMHAYMIFDKGRWLIGNMSSTNRVVVNGRPLISDDAQQVLEDGDRIELGELAFVFRAR